MKFEKMKQGHSLSSILKFAILFFSSLPLVAIAADEKPSPNKSTPASTERSCDVLVYGATSGGVAAAVEVAKSGKSVLIVEPGQHVGGLTSGGLGATDIGSKRAIGGWARQFYQRMGQHYSQPRSWKFQTREETRRTRPAGGYAEMWTFEPHVAEEAFREFLRDANVTVLFGERLDLKAGVLNERNRLVAFRSEKGLVIRARIFIDATYEGDLLAKAGLTYHVGREANSVYAETLNGVQSRKATSHQFTTAVDPYVTPGNAASGLLWGIQKEQPVADGTGDQRVQAYNFRMCLTDEPENRLPIPKPEGYDPLRYELLLRTLMVDPRTKLFAHKEMPNRKTDTNNHGPFSTDFIGGNSDYPEADYATRQKIVEEHRRYQLGLVWFLAKDPRVPEAVRHDVGRWGLCRDEFTDNGGWPHQLYVREARRMVSSYVMTQHNCEGRIVAADSIGLAAYTMDSHNVQRYARDGRVWNEGDVQVGGFPPYPISYRSICPRKPQCDNLLVPVCLSASHIAYGSIRMEPVFMVLGQSAGVAACLALERDIAVQDVNIEKLQERLLAKRQVLTWPPMAKPAEKNKAGERVNGQTTTAWRD